MSHGRGQEITFLLRAVDDLVCVSSACPDDTTSANGWNPTDIHVRIYDKSNNFSSATAFRPDPQSIPTMTKETGFHKNTSKLTKNFDNYNGYWLPLEYTNLGAIKEYWQCREGVVMIDLAPLRKFESLRPRLLRLSCNMRLPKMFVSSPLARLSILRCATRTAAWLMMEHFSALMIITFDGLAALMMAVNSQKNC